MRRVVYTCVVGVVLSLVPQPVRADEVTDWNQAMLRAGLIAGSTPNVMTRVAALVQAAVFDAVNGINPRYSPIHVTPAGPADASRRAATVQAAYVMLKNLYPAQLAALDARRIVSLDEIAAEESASSMASGIAWGQAVADAIWTWRSTDGFSVTAPFPDDLTIGNWRRTPNLPTSNTLSAPGVGYLQFSTQTPWVMTSPMQFRPPAPPALNSAQYARDFNETKLMGAYASTARSLDETNYALFWNAGTASYLWNRLAVALIEKNNRDRARTDGWSQGVLSPLLENARILAALDVSMADAAIACWDAKYTYHYWRPVTAIRETADDGNAATSPDTGWMPMFPTPGHPEYPSGHSCVSGAAAGVLTAEFGASTHFILESDLMIGYSRSYNAISEALEEVKNARIFSGIHFRTATEVGSRLGGTVAGYVLSQRFQRVN